MYHHCIFCSTDLGVNDWLEPFPVGEAIAFDGATGRLWAVCGRCGRWNLAPIEERWEAVEEAEHQFRESGMRVQRENIGIARLSDGTRLIRIGDALPEEVTSWRYGPELRQRRLRHRLQVVLNTGLALLGGVYVSPEWVVGKRPVGIHPATGSALRLRQLRGAEIRFGPGGDLRIAAPAQRGWLGSRPGARLAGDDARAVFSRVVTAVNHRGGSPGELAGAMELLRGASPGRSVVARPAGRPEGDERPLILGNSRRKGWRWEDPSAGGARAALSVPESLALEIALQEEEERRALEGELSGLRLAWKDADRIARIADALPGPDE